MKKAAANVASRPAPIEYGLSPPVITSAAGSSSSSRRFRMSPCESLTRKRVAPAVLAPAIAAFVSAVIQRQDRSYSGVPRITWRRWATPATPSMSTEMKTPSLLGDSPSPGKAVPIVGAGGNGVLVPGGLEQGTPPKIIGRRPPASQLVVSTRPGAGG